VGSPAVILVMKRSSCELVGMRGSEGHGLSPFNDGVGTQYEVGGCRPRGLSGCGSGGLLEELGSQPPGDHTAIH